MVLERISQQTPSVDTRIPVPTSNIPPTLTIDCTGKGDDKVALQVLDNAGAQSASLIADGNANFTCTTLDGTGLGDAKKMLTIKDNAGVTQAYIRASGGPTFRAIEVKGTGTGAGTTMFYITGDDGTSNFEVKESGVVTINGTGIAAGTTMLDLYGTGGGTTLQLTEDGIVKPQSIQFPDATIQTIAAGYGQFKKYPLIPGPKRWNLDNPIETALGEEFNLFYDLDMTFDQLGDPGTAFNVWIRWVATNMINSTTTLLLDGVATIPLALSTIPGTGSLQGYLLNGSASFCAGNATYLKGHISRCNEDVEMILTYSWWDINTTQHQAILTQRTTCTGLPAPDPIQMISFFLDHSLPQDFNPSKCKCIIAKKTEPV